MIELIPFTFTLLTHFLSYRLVSSSALVAYCSLGQPTGPVDPLTCQQLTLLGDHSLERSRTTLLHAGCDDLPLLCRVPSEFKNALAKAYAELNLLHDQALIVSYLNDTIPHLYEDEAKMSRALLLLPGRDLLDHERDFASRINAQARKIQFERDGHFDFDGNFGAYNPFMAF
jgi:hypothetical protein